MTWSAMARRPQRVLVDITDEPADDLVEAVLTREQLDFLGVRRQLSAADDAENVARAIGQLGPSPGDAVPPEPGGIETAGPPTGKPAGGGRGD